MARKGENITKRKDGRWEARIIKGRTIDGKARYQYIYGKSYSEVRRKKEDYIRSQAYAKQNKHDPNILFSEIAFEYLRHIQNEMKESSYCRYYEIIQKHILPFLGKKMLGELSTELIDEFTKMMNENGKINGSGGLSPKSVNDVLSVLKQIIKFSEKQGIIIQQLQFTHPKTAKIHPEILSRSDEEILVSHLLPKQNPMSFGVIISLYTGMRIGELCALRWNDINLKEQTIRINKTIQRIPDNAGEAKTKILISTPKTPSSIREIPIPSFLIIYFKTYRQMAIG